VSVFARQAGKRALPSPLFRKKLTELTLVVDAYVAESIAAGAVQYSIHLM
jgi:hypothetical protein